MQIVKAVPLPNQGDWLPSQDTVVILITTPSLHILQPPPEASCGTGIVQLLSALFFTWSFAFVDEPIATRSGWQHLTPRLYGDQSLPEVPSRGSS